MAIPFERRCWAEINLDTLRDNFTLIRRAAGPARIMAVVKANAYGHGDVVTARTLDAAGAEEFAVACLAEAVRLRQAGISKPILVLGYTNPRDADSLVEYKLQQCVFSLEYARRLSTALSVLQAELSVHFKVDTGMGRLGFCATGGLGTVVDELYAACSLPELRPVGLFTHFAAADSTQPEDVAYTKAQTALFWQVQRALAARKKQFATKHLRNSAGLITQPEASGDMVRPGIILYGCAPSAQVKLPGLRPALQVKAAIAMIKELPEGSQISYGRTFTTPCPMRVATLTAGYADGYPRLLSGQGMVGIHGTPAKLLGRVCMDQLVVDVTHIPEARAGDTATLFGGNGADTAEQAAAKCGTISYEILCGIGHRVPRLYLENGREIAQQGYLAPAL